MPPAGTYTCSVLDVQTAKSKNKGTPYIDVTLSNGEYEFNDQLYVTARTINRLCLFAKRVCGMSDDTEIPDDDLEAAKFVANYIMKNAVDNRCMVTVEENDEKFMPESGPDMGRTITIKRRRVAFTGYERYNETESTTTTKKVTDEDLPF